LVEVYKEVRASFLVLRSLALRRRRVALSLALAALDGRRVEEQETGKRVWGR
jgi:hypothetical protein